MWIVQATYTRGSSRGSHVAGYDEHGDPIIEEDSSKNVKPWLRPATVTESPYEINSNVITEVYTSAGVSFELTNKAGTPIPVTAAKYGRKITIEYDKQAPKHWCASPKINEDRNVINGFVYEPHTLLLMPFYPQEMVWTSNKRREDLLLSL